MRPRLRAGFRGFLSGRILPLVMVGVLTLPLETRGADRPRAEDSMRAAAAAAALMAVGIPRFQSPSQAREWVLDHPVSLLLLYGSDGTLDVATTTLRAMGTRPPLLAIDQEGGTVLRHPPAQIPSAMALGAAGSEALTRRAGRAVGCRLVRAGFDVAFAPVLDLAAETDAAALGTRSFGSDPAAVAAHGRAFAEGLREGGVLPVVKHFPGMGSASADPHHETASASAADEIPQSGLAPFARVLPVAAGVMAAHVSYPPLETRPATFSPLILRDLLRTELKFEGVVLTDVLHMEGALASWDAGERAVRAVEAGADLVLVAGAREARATLAGLTRAIETGRIDSARVQASMERLARLRDSARASPGCETDEGVDLEIARAAVTGIGPRPALGGDEWFAGEDGAVSRRFRPERRILLSPSPSSRELAEAAARLEGERGWIVAAVRNRRQVAALEAIRHAAPKAKWLLIGLGAPQDLAGVRADAWLFTYGFLPESQQAAAEVLFDGRCAPGRLPVAVRGVGERGAGERCVSSGARGSR